MSTLNYRNNPVSMVIADPQPVIRTALVNYFESTSDFHVVGEAERAPDFRDLTMLLRPDLIIQEVVFERFTLDGLAAATYLRAQIPRLKIVVFSDIWQPKVLLDVLRVPIDGYVSKSVDVSELAGTIHEVSNGSIVLSHPVADLIKFVGSPDHYDLAINPREIEIMDRVARGLRNDEIARDLNLAISTIRASMTTIFRKLGARNRVGAVIEAYRLGLIELSGVATPSIC